MNNQDRGRQSKSLTANPETDVDSIANKNLDRFNESHPYFHLKKNRDNLRDEYIRSGKMSDPDSRTSLDNAIDMVGEVNIYLIKTLVHDNVSGIRVNATRA